MDTLTEKKTYTATGKKPNSMLTKKSIHVGLLLGSDLTAFFVAVLIQFLVVFQSGFFGRYDISGAEIPVLGLMVYTVYSTYWLGIFFLGGMYKNWYEWSPFDEIWSIAKASIFGWLVAYFFIMFDSQNPPRMMVLFGASLFFFSVVGFRFVARRIQKQLREKKLFRYDSIVFGCHDKALELISKIKKSPSWGYHPKAFVEYNSDKGITEVKNSIQKSIDFHAPDTIILTTDVHDHDLLFEIANLAAENKLKVKIEPDLYHIFTGQTKAHNIYGIPLIEVSPQLLKPWQDFAKRVFDIIFSSLVIVIGSPLWLLLAIGVKIDSPGPIFYSQMRVGKNNKPFRIYKFRSMRPSSDKTQRWTSVGDKRVTKWGKFIRKTHLDEIPQFWNVLIGDMSIVGPRPEQPHFVDDFQAEIPYYNRRHVVRPGITGWWQINYGPYVVSIDEIKSRLKDDFFYIENMSIKLDIEIVTRTVWCVLKGHGQA
ncbi:MAG: undecaprenyl-phosphate glucose phosphotransferase [Candidatus Kapaibacteriales bacterium]